MVAGFGMSVLLARSLGVEGRGSVAAALLWPQLLIYISSLGVHESSLYFAATSKWPTGVVFANAVVISLIQTFLFVPVAYVILPFLLNSQTSDIVTSSQQLLIIIPFGLLTLNGFNITRAKLNFTAYYMAQAFVPVTTVFIVIILAFNNSLSYQSVIVTYAVVYPLSILLLLWVFLRKQYWMPIRTNWVLSKAMLAFGAKVQFGAISQLANVRLDQVFMAALLPVSQLGLYVVAASAANIARSISTAARTVLTPYIASQQGENIDKALLSDKLRKYWLINVAAGLMLLVILPFAVPFVFGKEFSAAILTTEILVVATIFLGGKEILSGATYGLGSPELVSQSEIIALFFTFLGLFLLLPAYGIVGAAVATLFSYMIALAFLAFQLERKHDLQFKHIFVLRWRDFVVVVQEFFSKLLAKE
jgi:O-antigen/teichoic acid export membrane protein